MGIRNPSAYVCKSVANNRHDVSSPSMSGGATASRRDELLFHEELAKVNGSLDEKAMDILGEIGFAAGAKVVKALNDAGDKVNNPNAYVMKAAGNEKRNGGAQVSGFPP